MTMELLTVIGGIMLSVVGFFLKRTMDELKEVKIVAYKTKTKVEVIEKDYINKVENLNEKFDMLYDAVKELTSEIKTLNQRMR
jgi:flagellar capping protein FliD